MQKVHREKICRFGDATVGLQIAPNPAQNFVMIESNNEFPIDQIYVYDLNGRLVKAHMDINSNSLYLPLKMGVNKIHCVVIDKANGWGLIAKLE